jgi:hypothetical protein
LAGELPKWDVFPSISSLPSPSLWDMDMTLPDVAPELELESTGNFFPESRPIFVQPDVL